uniref:Uncharacterized protein n=1 Tax=Glossina austeni TaxID=7395 RepID=A0A1A9UEZ7_GLOAU
MANRCFTIYPNETCHINKMPHCIKVIIHMHHMYTLRRQTKDYGHTKVREANTPYPRREDPVDPSALRQRLLELFGGLHFLKDDDTDKSSSNEQSLGSRTENFLKKRKEFTLCEFTCTRQRSMSFFKQEPGCSVGTNWRTLAGAKNSIALSRTNRPRYSHDLGSSTN